MAREDPSGSARKGAFRVKGNRHRSRSRDGDSLPAAAVTDELYQLVEH
jgi:hypothetical protein